jgi:hypothetical protein
VNGNSWTINTNYPVFYSCPDTDTQPVRCVRNFQGGGTLISYSANTIFDGRTGLYWQKATIAPSSWSAAVAACDALTLDGFTDWRLPSMKELGSIVDDNSTNPAISPLFTERQAEAFWSSTPLGGWPADAYAIHFGNGSSSGINTPGSTLLRVRCVR